MMMAVSVRMTMMVMVVARLLVFMVANAFTFQNSPEYPRLNFNLSNLSQNW